MAVDCIAAEFSVGAAADQGVADSREARERLDAAGGAGFVFPTIGAPCWRVVDVSVAYEQGGEGMTNWKALIGDVERWAEDRGILQHSTPTAQLLKTMSELDELADATNKHIRERMNEDPTNTTSKVSKRRRQESAARPQRRVVLNDGGNHGWC
jgi:hypothetical protein